VPHSSIYKSMMEIIVIAKQVQMVDSVKCDFAGVEGAIRLKRKTDANIKVVVMGKEKDAIAQVRDAISMGADSGVVLAINDDNYDSWTVAVGFCEYLKNQSYDVIMSGSFPIDADTIQTGLLTGNMLGLTSVSHIEDVETGEKNNALVLKKRMEDRVQLYEVKTPCMLSTLPHPEAPIYKTVPGINKAYSTDIPVIYLDLKAQKGKIIVADSFKIGERKRGKCLTAISTEGAVKEIIGTISTNHIL